jgi:putative hydrolase of the HAD superfamily
MKRPIILTDADNTLWDTDSVFANAQTALLEIVEKATRKYCPEGDRLAFVRHCDQALAAIHHAHLKYPPMLLVQALALALDGTDAKAAANSALKGNGPASILDQAAIDVAVEQYLTMLGDIPRLLPTVLDGLLKLCAEGVPAYIVTEGNVEKQKTILMHHALGAHVAGVFEVVKNQAQFARLQQRFTSNEVIVIGDQPDRDIVPAKIAGCTTVLVPSRFRPHWHDAQQWNDADFIASTFKEAIEWVLHRAPDDT